MNQQAPYPPNQGYQPMDPQQTPQQYPGQQVQGYDPQSSYPTESRGKSGLAIAGLVLGIVAVATSFIPIVNNASFFIAIVGLILGIIGFVQTRKGTKSGSGLAIAAIVLNIVAFVVVLATQAMYSAAIDEAFSTSSASVVSSSATTTDSTTSTTAPETSASSSTSTSSSSTTDMPIGTVAEVGDGLQVSVNSVTPGLVNYDGKQIVAVNVTYTNTGSKVASFNPYDWKAETAQGVQTSETYYSKAENELNSGSLAVNGTVTGNIYFEADVAKVLYIENMFLSRDDVSWIV